MPTNIKEENQNVIQKLKFIFIYYLYVFFCLFWLFIVYYIIHGKRCCAIYVGYYSVHGCSKTKRTEMFIVKNCI